MKQHVFAATIILVWAAYPTGPSGAADGAIDFVVENQTNATVESIGTSDTSGNKWSILETSISPAYELPIHLPSTTKCQNDVLVKLSNNLVKTIRAVDLCAVERIVVSLQDGQIKARTGRRNELTPQTITSQARSHFETQVRQLQQSWWNNYVWSSYIPVSIAGYYSHAEVWTESRLYRDHVALFANMNYVRKGSSLWNELTGLGLLKSDGSGLTYYFGDLNPCSELKPSITNTSTLYSITNGQVCLRQNVIEITTESQVETRGTNTTDSKQYGICRVLPNGHCQIFSNIGRPQTFLVRPK